MLMSPLSQWPSKTFDPLSANLAGTLLHDQEFIDDCKGRQQHRVTDKQRLGIPQASLQLHQLKASPWTS